MSKGHVSQTVEGYVGCYVHPRTCAPFFFPRYSLIQSLESVIVPSNVMAKDGVPIKVKRNSIWSNVGLKHAFEFVVGDSTGMITGSTT